MSKGCVRLAVVVALALGAVLGSADRLHAAQSISLERFIGIYMTGDRELEAAGLRLEASRAALRSKSYLSYPSLRFDLGSPYYSWYRNYSYMDYLGTTYRGYLEYEDQASWLKITMRQPLPTGGDLSLEGSTRRDRTVFSYTGFPAEIPVGRDVGDRQFLADVGVSLDQPLLGFWEKRDAAGRASLELEKAKVTNRTDGAASAKRAINLFFDYLVGEKKVAEEKGKLARARLEAGQAQSQFAQGLVTEIELLAKQVEANGRGVAYSEAVASFERASGELARVIGQVPGEPRADDLAGLLGAAALNVDTSGVCARESPEVLKAKYDAEIARIGLAQAGRRRFGETSVSLWYGLQGLGDDYAQARNGFGRNKWGASLSIGLSLPDPGLSSDVELARANLKVAQADYDRAVELGREEAPALVERVRSLEANMRLERRQVDLLQQLTETRRDQYGRELLSERDMIILEGDLLTARIALLETTRKLCLGWVDLILRSGVNPADVMGKSR